MRIVSWNVNGLRALAKKGVFLDFLESCQADVVALQETRTLESQLTHDVRHPKGGIPIFPPPKGLDTLV